MYIKHHVYIYIHTYVCMLYIPPYRSSQRLRSRADATEDLSGLAAALFKCPLKHQQGLGERMSRISPKKEEEIMVSTWAKGFIAWVLQDLDM